MSNLYFPSLVLQLPCQKGWKIESLFSAIKGLTPSTNCPALQQNPFLTKHQLQDMRSKLSVTVLALQVPMRGLAFLILLMAVCRSAIVWSSWLHMAQHHQGGFADGQCTMR